jgi:hypothetical protein
MARQLNVRNHLFTVIPPWNTPYRYLSAVLAACYKFTRGGECNCPYAPLSCCNGSPMGSPESVAQKRTVLSHDALANFVPSGEREMELMKSV